MFCKSCRSPIAIPGLDHSFCKVCDRWVLTIAQLPQPQSPTAPELPEPELPKKLPEPATSEPDQLRLF